MAKTWNSCPIIPMCGILHPANSSVRCMLDMNHDGSHFMEQGRAQWSWNSAPTPPPEPDVCGNEANPGGLRCERNPGHPGMHRSNDGDERTWWGDLIPTPEQTAEILKMAEEGTEPDPVNHPAHYTSHPSGVECITITEHMSFTLGNALKYIWRADEKGDALEDLRKARWYIDREISRREKAAQ